MNLLHLSVYHDLFFLTGVLLFVGAAIFSLVRHLFFSKKEAYCEEGSNMPNVPPVGKSAGNDSDFFDPPVKGDRIGYRRRRCGCLKLLGANFLCFVVKRGKWFARLRRRRDGRGPEFLVPVAQLVRL